MEKISYNVINRNKFSRDVNDSGFVGICIGNREDGKEYVRRIYKDTLYKGRMYGYPSLGGRISNKEEIDTYLPSINIFGSSSDIEKYISEHSLRNIEKIKVYNPYKES